ncbi:MAG: bifunctional lysylphosphatidylglycerol flippase/synthetase MprF [Peptostreptococcaceae bacterium]
MGMKIAFVILILIIVAKEFRNIISGFNIDNFKMYADKLSIGNIAIIIMLGILSYIPLSFYDFILKKRVGIDLNNNKLYKFSWIASSISSIVGFGGSSAIALKSNFYNPYVKDKKLLVKEISKIVALNLTGFSMACFIYLIISKFNLGDLNLMKVLTIVIAMYLPVITIVLIGKYIKANNEEKRNIIDTFKIIGISLLEWITTVILIYSIILILGEKISIIKFFPIFVAAIAVAIVSMSPGGLGTFDLTLLLGLRSLGVSSEKVMLAVFLYRISYYIIPLIIGLGLYVSELYIKLDKDIKEVISSNLSKIAHYGIIFLVFSAGIVLLASQAMPIIVERVQLIKSLFGLKIMNMSGDISILIGFLLVAISSMMACRSKLVYKIAMVLVILGGILSLTNGFDYEESIYLLIVGAILRISKKQFYRESFVMSWGYIIKNIFVLLSFQLLYIYVVYNNLNFKVATTSMFSLSSYYTIGYVRKIGYVSAIGFIGSLVFLGILYYLNKKNKFPKLKLYQCKDVVDDILNKYNGSSVIHFIHLNDKFVYINKDEDVFMQYQISANKIFVLGNIIGNKDKFFETIQDFYELADKYGYTPVFCAVDKKMIPYLHETGYEFIKLGEEATVNLDTFTLDGRKMKSVRNAISRVDKEGYRFEMVYPPFSGEFIKEINNISNEWLSGRDEKGFSVGFFDENYLNRDAIAVVKNRNGEIKGFTNLMPMYDGKKTLSIDLMRFSKDSCNGVMDFIFVNLFKHGQENGYSRFNMGMAPLSNVGRSKYSFLSERIAAKVYSHGQHFYSFEGLKKFKEKYCESWDCRYMAYKKKTSLVFTMLQAILLVSKGKKYKYEDYEIELNQCEQHIEQIYN